jgi:hypothetical protein
MVEISTLLMMDGSYVFQIPIYDDSDKQQGLLFRFTVPALRAEAAFSYLAAKMADDESKWLYPRAEPSGPWVMHLDTVAAQFKLNNQSWLSGQREVIPVFDEVADGRERRGSVLFTVPVSAPPRSLAPSVPQDSVEGLSAFLSDHPEPEPCGFLMMSFTKSDQHSRIAKAVKETCAKAGLKALRADESRYSADLFPNIRTYMHGCSFGIAIFERIESDDFNPNVSLEVGYMLGMGKPVCLLKDKNLKGMQSDLMGRLYEVFDLNNIDASISDALGKWLLLEKRLRR